MLYSLCYKYIFNPIVKLSLKGRKAPALTTEGCVRAVHLSSGGGGARLTSTRLQFSGLDVVLIADPWRLVDEEGAGRLS